MEFFGKYCKQVLQRRNTLIHIRGSSSTLLAMEWKVLVHKIRCVPLSDIVQPFQRIPLIPNVFIFDCCRRFANFLSSFTPENTLVIYSTKPGRDAYASADVGSLMTKKLAFLFCREKTSISTIITKLSNELREFQVCCATSLQLNQPISLLEEQESASMLLCVV